MRIYRHRFAIEALVLLLVLLAGRTSAAQGGRASARSVRPVVASKGPSLGMDFPRVFASLGLPVYGGVLSGGVGLTEFAANSATLVEESLLILRQLVTRLFFLRFGLVHSRRSPSPGAPVAWKAHPAQERTRATSTIGFLGRLVVIEV